MLDSPGDGFFSTFHLSVCSPGSRGPRCPCPPGLTCQFLSHLPSLGSWRGFWTSAGCVAPAPAARLLANSDYFSFSVLSWVPLFLTVHFSLDSGLKKKKKNPHIANTLVSPFLNHCCAAPGSHGPVLTDGQSLSPGLPILWVLELLG